MEVPDLFGWGLSAAGVAISLYALVKAENAQRAAASVIKKGSDQAARDAARDLLSVVNNAKEAAMTRRKGAGRGASAGRNLAADITILQRAQDALATITISADHAVDQDMRAAALELQQALKVIALNSRDDGWGLALDALQAIYPKINTIQRGLGTKALS